MPSTASPLPGNAPVLPIALIVVLYLAFSVYRRTRAQKVRPWRAVLITAAIVVVSLFGIVATARSMTETLFVVLMLIGLAVGIALGLQMMRSIRFWRDDTTGELWMQGGVLYVVVWLGSYLLRYGARFAATGSLFPFSVTQTAQPETTLGLLSSALLFLSIGLWISRAYALVQKYRENRRDAVQA
ncbi:MAG TPA: hypothetical protein VNL16_04960 [Chloroflexota bacterium]|nr:hypothetical protein [Chloroflexota bacterium]